MAKTPKAPPITVTTEMIDKAAKTSAVTDLVRLADAFARAGIYGPFMVELPLFGSVMVKDNGYRQHSIPTGTRVNATNIRLGKRGNLIFTFHVEGEWVCDKGPVEWVELTWDDVINSFSGLSDRIEGYLEADESNGRHLVSEIDGAVKGAIKRNPAMHKVLSEGFALAQTHKVEGAQRNAIEDNPLFGAF